MSLRVGSELVLRIEPEFGVWSCVTQSHNNKGLSKSGRYCERIRKVQWVRVTSHNSKVSSG